MNNDPVPTRILRTNSLRIPKTPKSGHVVKTSSFEVPKVCTQNKLNSDEKVKSEIKDLEAQFHSQLTMECLVGNYFLQVSNKSKVVSSKKTLADLGNHKLTPEQATRLMSKLPDPVCIKEIEERMNMLKEATFPVVWQQLKNGYNVLVHGFGSKLSLVQSFVWKYLSEKNCVEIPGYEDNLSVSQIFIEIIDAYAVPMQTSSRSATTLACAIRDHFSNDATGELYLVVHNIDRLAVNSTLDAFAILAESPFIRMLSSVDHRFADRLWARNDIDWVWHDWTTLRPYTAETRSGNSRFMSEQSTVGLDSLRAVTASLHANAKQVFRLLAKLEIQKKNEKYEGMPVEKLLSLSKESLYVTNEAGLRSLLTEFKDHKLIQFKGSDGQHLVKLALDPDSIQKFVDNFDEF